MPAEAPTMEPLVIGGRRGAAAAGRCLPLTNPATGELLARVARAGEQDVARAVAAAARAKTAWERAGPTRRAVLSALADLMNTELKTLFLDASVAPKAERSPAGVG